MIVIRISGGIGNQMFQYAFARYLSHKTNLPLKLDIKEYELNTYPHRPYRLGVFKIQEHFLTDNERIAYLNKPLLKRIYQKMLPVYSRSYFKEKQYSFDSDAIKINQGTYIEGYYQSEKYFNSIADILRKEFVFQESVQGKNLEMLNGIKACNAVSIHVRRGDFLTQDSFVKLGLPYYKRAIEIIVEKVKKPYFFIFSNGMDWCKDNLSDLASDREFVDINDELTAYEDMRLMSNCKHHIIANSSFSWWSAWLNSNPDKIVITPTQITYDPYYDPKDLYPDNWLRIPIQ